MNGRSSVSGPVAKTGYTLRRRTARRRSTRRTGRADDRERRLRMRLMVAAGVWAVVTLLFPGVVFTILPRLLADSDPAVSSRVFAAMQQMVKLDIAALKRAAAG